MFYDVYQSMVNSHCLAGYVGSIGIVSIVVDLVIVLSVSINLFTFQQIN